MIITGSAGGEPGVRGGELLADELSTIMEWSEDPCDLRPLHICWGAQAGLYYHYGIPKYQREKKLAGIHPPQGVKPEGPAGAQHGRLCAGPSFPLYRGAP